MWATFCIIKVSVMKHDAYGFLPKINFSEKNIQLFSSFIKYPDLKLDMFTRFWVLVYSHFVAPSDH